MVEIDERLADYCQYLLKSNVTEIRKVYEENPCPVVEHDLDTARIHLQNITSAMSKTA